MAKSHLSLARLLNTPQLDRIVPHLPPAVLHRVIQHYGLEDCAELVALASPEQVARLLDEDVWRTPAGEAAAFDVERFGVWLAVLMQSGVEAAVDQLAGLDADLVITGLAATSRSSIAPPCRRSSRSRATSSRDVRPAVPGRWRSADISSKP